MKMKKIGQFFRKYGFYVAIAVICVGALTAIFVLPGQEGNVKNEANPYARNEQAGGNLVGEQKNNVIVDEEDELDKTDNVAKQQIESKVDPSNKAATDSETAKSGTTKNNEKVAVSEEAKKEVTTETFESTTATGTSEPFFADGDSFGWPVVGEVVVPYTDESTKYWFSESLNQTMRTFGICIAAGENTEVKAVARGTVTKIVEDSSTVLGTYMPYVGKLVVIDHGNGYVSLYGFQGGEVNTDLLGKVVNEGDVLGKVGTPKGAFINEGDNLYLQVLHNDKVVNPMDFFKSEQQSADLKTEGVDIGFSAK